MNSSFSYPSQTQTGQPAQALPSELGVTLHTAQLRDVPALSRLLADSFHPPNSWWFWLYPLLRLGIHEDLRTRLKHQRPQYKCWTATGSTQPRVIGTVEIAVRPIHDGHCWFEAPYVSNLAVHPRYRRRGIARELLLKCEPQAVRWGFEEIYLHVLDNNRQAQGLYERLGYQVVSTEFTYINWLLQQPRRVLLHKRLVRK